MWILQAATAVKGLQASYSTATTLAGVSSARAFVVGGTSLRATSLRGQPLSIRLPASAVGARKSSQVLKVKARTLQAVSMAAAATPVEVLVKAAPDHPDLMGDCPFSQRVLLTLEEKNIPYNAKLIDLSEKPAWFLEASPEGKVPVLKDDGKWIADSDVITELLEKKFPDPSLAAPATTVGSKLFGAFVQYLRSRDPKDGKEQVLLDEIKELDSHLKEKGPFLNGEKISALDLALAPKLYHLKIALGHYKDWAVPSEYTSLNSYMESLFSRKSFKNTKPSDDFVVRGWESKVLPAR